MQFTSYIFNFQGIIVGPLCFYRDYIEFINGDNFKKYQVTSKKRKYNSNKISLFFNFFKHDSQRNIPSVKVIRNKIRIYYKKVKIKYFEIFQESFSKKTVNGFVVFIFVSKIRTSFSS